MAAASGVQAKDEVVTAFKDIKMAKKYRYVMFKVEDCKKYIGVEKEVGKGEQSQEEAWEDFKKLLPADDGRYVVYDFEVEINGHTRNPLVFLVWIPDSAAVRRKMLYSSSKDALKKKLDGINHEIQASDMGDLTYGEIIETLKQKIRT